MKKFFSIFAIGTSLFFVSCKKETINAPNPDPTPVKKNLVNTTLNEDRSFVYNPDGTIKEISQNGLGYEYREVYTHSANKISFDFMYKGQKTGYGEYILANGKVTSFTETGYDNGVPTSSYSFTFTYNDKGLLKKKESQDGDYVLFTYDANDNLIKLVEYDSQNQPGEMQEFTYGNQKDLFPQYSFLNSSNSGFFFPPFSKYLPVSKKGTQVSNGADIGSGTLSYELDADGYVLKGKYTKTTVGTNSYEWINTFQ